jgi:hypothetical protein
VTTAVVGWVEHRNPTSLMSITSGTLRDRVIILTGYEDALQWRLPNGRLRQRLPPVRYANEPQTLGLLSSEAQPNLRRRNITS